MRTLISCKYHEDSTVELLYTDGTLIDIDCMAAAGHQSMAGKTV